MIPFILAFGPLDTPKLLQKLAIHRQLKPFSSSSLIYSSISSYYLNLNQNNAYIRHYKDTGIKTMKLRDCISRKRTNPDYPVYLFVYFFSKGLSVDYLQKFHHLIQEL